MTPGVVLLYSNGKFGLKTKRERGFGETQQEGRWFDFLTMGRMTKKVQTNRRDSSSMPEKSGAAATSCNYRRAAGFNVCDVLCGGSILVS
jgi:hypothetical protein